MGQLIEDPDRTHRASFLWGVLQGAQDGQIVLVVQRHADGLDFLGRTVGEVGERAIFDLASFAVRLAQEDTTIPYHWGQGESSL